MKSKILIIDDNEDILYNIRLLLEFNNYDVITASNGKDGLDVLNTLDIPPDLILCDIMMPVMNGYDFFTKVVKISKWSQIPFIFLTAKSTPEDVSFGKLLGVDDYVTKPFKEKYLIDVIAGKFTRNRQTKVIIEKLEKKIKEIENLVKPSVNISQIENISIFHIDWDETRGPVLISEYTPKSDSVISAQELGMQLFQTTVAIYGHSDYSEAKSVLLSVDNFKMDAVVYFDSIIDKSVRGDQRQFMLAVIAPTINYLEFLKIKSILSELSIAIKETGNSKNIYDFWIKISEILTCYHQ